LLLSNGSPVDVRNLSGWHEVQPSQQAESLQGSPTLSVNTALRAPSH
jgi:hypothetical protein